MHETARHGEQGSGVEGTAGRLRLMRWEEVMEITGMSRQSLLKMAANGWFPRPVQCSAQATRFLSNEVEAWLEELKSRRVQYKNARPWERQPAPTTESLSQD